MKFPYRSLSNFARENNKTNVVFYSEIEDPSQVRCPWDPAKSKECVRCEQTCLLVRDPSDQGRIPGSRLVREPEGSFDMACCLHLPAPNRPELPKSYTTVPAAVCCYECSQYRVQPPPKSEPSPEPELFPEEEVVEEIDNYGDAVAEYGTIEED